MEHGNPKHGPRYHLKVQIDQSGPDQKFSEVKPATGPKVKGDLAFYLESNLNPDGAATLTLTYQGIELPGVAVDIKDAGEGITGQVGQIAFQISADTGEVDFRMELRGKLEGDIGQDAPQPLEPSGELTIQLEGNVTGGGTATLTVTYQGTPLPKVHLTLTASMGTGRHRVRGTHNWPGVCSLKPAPAGEAPCMSLSQIIGMLLVASLRTTAG